MINTKKSFSPSLFLLLLTLAIIAGLLIFSTSLKRLAPSKENTPIACAVPNSQTLTGEFDSLATSAWWLGESVTPLTQPLAEATPTNRQVLGESDSNKWIEIDLDKQHLYAHEGDAIIFETPISSGKYAPTPTGEYNIWYKVKYTKMSGGIKGTGTYYYLPNVPYTMFFYQGYGVHGTYWHNTFGHPMSHGCVNTPTPAAARLFDWASPVVPEDKNSIMASPDNPGTRVVVHGRAPKN